MLLQSKIEICILAGGLSTRMGRDKTRLRLNGRSMMTLVRAIAAAPGYPVRIIRRDMVPRCGPLGGIITGLRDTKAEAVLFLACDMPLVTPALLRKIIRAGDEGLRAVFSSQAGRVGFPILLPTKTADAVQQQIAARCLSIQQLAGALRAQKLRVSSGSRQLFNVNTPEEVCIATKLLLRTKKAKPATA